MAFHSEFLKTKFEVQDGNSPFLFQLNYDFIHPMGAEMNQEYRETNGLRNGGVNTENLMIDHRPFSSSRRTIFIKTKMKHDRRSHSLIAINGRDEMSFGETMSSSDDRPIFGERSRFVHVD